MIKMENDKKKKIKPGKNCIKIIIDVPKMKKKKNDQTFSNFLLSFLKIKSDIRSISHIQKANKIKDKIIKI